MHGAVKYAGPVVAVLAAFALRWVMIPIMGLHTPYIIVFPAMMIAALIGGIRPGLVAAVIGYVLTETLIVTPQGGLDRHVSALVNFIVVGGSTAYLGWIGNAMRRAHRRSEAIVEEALRRSDAHLRRRTAELSAILNSISDGLVVEGPERSIVAINPSAMRLSGQGSMEQAQQTLEELARGRADVTLLDRDGRAIPFDDSPFTRAGRREPFRELEVTLVADGAGTRMTWRLTGAPVRDERGEDTGLFVMTFHDVTERLRIEQALRESEERYRLAVTALPGLVYDWEVPTGRISRTEGMRDLIGVEPDEVPAEAAWWLEQIEPSDLVAAAAKLKAAMAAKVPALSTEYRVRHRDGRWIWVWDQLYIIYDDAGQAVRVVGCTISIDDRRRAEEALRESEARFRRLVDANIVGIACWTLAGEICEANDELLRMLGFSRAELEAGAVRWDVLTPPEHRDAMGRAMERLRSTGVCPPFESELSCKEGGRVPVLVSGASFAEEGGDRGIAFMLDLTELKQAEAALRAADRRKDEFLATLAHELRNPLAPLRNALHILKQPGVSPEAFDRTRAMMERQLGQMVRLIDDLLDVGRITRNALELHRERVELAAVIERAVESSQPLIDAAGHVLAVTLPSRPVHLDADLARLTQVFSNLLNNAARYTPSGGRIWLSAELCGHEVVIVVRDTGIGIPGDMLPRIFDMFTQVSSQPERGQGGLGIGLTLVRRLVEMHGGAVEARSEGRGRGSELVVRLPVARGEADRDAAAQPPAAQGPRRRVLVVDDNLDAAETLAALLELAGNEVYQAHDGEVAVTEASRLRPDVVLLDIGLPRLSGYEVARRIREQPWGRHMMLVALTGWGQAEDRLRSRAAGFDAHLTKPVDPAVLMALLAAGPEHDGSGGRDACGRGAALG